MPQAMRRSVHRVVTGGCVAALTTSVIAVGGLQPAPPGIREASYEVMTVASIIESATTVGISDNLYMLNNTADIGKSLDMMQSLGIKDVRVAVPWVWIQSSGASTYDWTKMDTIVNAAASRGMGVLGVLTGTPSWAGSVMTGHSDPNAFATFAGAVAGHYGNKISTYEIWNEPNSTWAYNPIDPAAYTAMLKAGYTAIKAATNGAAEVIGGVVGAGQTQGTSALNPVSFVTAMYAAGAHGYFDALSFHPYTGGLKFSQGPTVMPGISALDQVTAIRALMNANGDAAQKIWLTEYGVPTNAVTEQQQGALIQDLVQYWQHVAGGGPIFLYNTRDTSPDPNTDIFDNNFGLFHYDWTPKAAAAIVKSLIASLKPVTNPFAALLASIQHAFSSWSNSFTAGAQKFLAALAAIFKPKSAAAVSAAKSEPAVTNATPVASATVTAAEPSPPATLHRRGAHNASAAKPANAAAAADTQPGQPVASHRHKTKADKDIRGKSSPVKASRKAQTH